MTKTKIKAGTTAAKLLENGYVNPDNNPVALVNHGVSRFSDDAKLSKELTKAEARLVLTAFGNPEGWKITDRKFVIYKRLPSLIGADGTIAQLGRYCGHYSWLTNDVIKKDDPGFIFNEAEVESMAIGAYTDISVEEVDGIEAD